MKELTFKTFLRILDEDVNSDISKLQADISMLDTEITKRTQPLMLQKQRLQKLLAVKQRQQQAETKKQGAPNNDQQQQQQSNQTTTPGSTGASTPGQQ